MMQFDNKQQLFDGTDCEGNIPFIPSENFQWC